MHVVARADSVVGHPLRVRPEPASRSLVCEAATTVRRTRSRRSPTRRARRRRRARRSLGGGEVQGGGELRGASAPPGGPAPTARGSPCAAWSTSRRRRPRTARAISGRHRVSTSLAIRPQASVQRTSASPSRVTVARAVCHGVDGARSEPRGDRGTDDASWRVRPPRARRSAAMVPAAPPTWTGKTSAVRSSYASRTPVSHCAALSPNVVGTACWVSVRATIGVPRWLSTSRPAAAICPRSSSLTRTTASPAQIISAVSTTSWLVRPRCSHRAAVRRSSSSPLAQQRDQRHRRVATGLGLVDEPLLVVSSHQAGRSRAGGRAARCRRSTSASSQAVSTADMALAEGRVGEVVARAVVAGPEEVRHVHQCRG